MKEPGLVKDTEISKRVLKHTKEINEFQDKIFKLAEMEQVTSVVSIGGAITFAVTMLVAYEKEDPEMGEMMKRVVKKIFKLSGVEL